MATLDEPDDKLGNAVRVYLPQEERAAVRRVLALHPDDAVSLNRVLRACILRGAPILERELTDRVRVIAAATEPKP